MTLGLLPKFSVKIIMWDSCAVSVEVATALCHRY